MRQKCEWAGHDAIIRAKHSWDLSATEGVGRAKAEHNLQILAGNDRRDGNLGSVLIEIQSAGLLRLQRQDRRGCPVFFSSAWPLSSSR